MNLLPRILPRTELALLNQSEFNIALRARSRDRGSAGQTTVRLAKWVREREPSMAKGVESWRLFWLLALTISVAICLGLPLADFQSARGTTVMILRSLRIALPLFLLAFAASSLATLWPNPLTRWLLRNRRYVGLAFAFGMAWHLSFVGYSIFSFGLSASGLTPRGLALDLIGLIFLLLMTVTSFRWSARRLTPANWRRLHKTGVYVIWFVAMYIYAHNLRDILPVVAFSLLIAAWLLRVAAWVNRRVRGPIPTVSTKGTSKQ
jgi:methionine sulfoxide reductase heme-binding subunit